MDIISRKYINEGFNSKAYIINDDYILLDGVNQNSYKNYQKYVNVLSYYKYTDEDLIKRGKGYGTGLISFARDYAKTIDCYEMFLITNRSNISACKCYEKAGGINDADDEVVYVYDFREEN